MRGTFAHDGISSQTVLQKSAKSIFKAAMIFPCSISALFWNHPSLFKPEVKLWLHHSLHPYFIFHALACQKKQGMSVGEQFCWHLVNDVGVVCWNHLKLILGTHWYLSRGLRTTDHSPFPLCNVCQMNWKYVKCS